MVVISRQTRLDLAGAGMCSGSRQSIGLTFSAITVTIGDEPSQPLDARRESAI